MGYTSTALFLFLPATKIIKLPCWNKSSQLFSISARHVVTYVRRNLKKRLSRKCWPQKPSLIFPMFNVRSSLHIYAMIDDILFFFMITTTFTTVFHLIFQNPLPFVLCSPRWHPTCAAASRRRQRTDVVRRHSRKALRKASGEREAFWGWTVVGKTDHWVR